MEPRTLTIIDSHQTSAIGTDVRLCARALAQGRPIEPSGERASRGWQTPDQQHQGTFEDKAISMWRCSQPGQPTLKSVGLDDILMATASRFGQVPEFGQGRGGDIGDSAPAHVEASR
jgi:hypothetical protein